MYFLATEKGIIIEIRNERKNHQQTMTDNTMANITTAVIDYMFDIVKLFINNHNITLLIKTQ